MKKLHKTLTALMVGSLVFSIAMSSFAQTPSVASNAPDSTNAKTRQRFAAKRTDDKPAETTPSDATKR